LEELEDNAMQKLPILAIGMAALVGLWVASISVAAADDNSNNPDIALVDNCDPATFNAVIPGACATTKNRHTTTFAEFASLLFSPLAVNVIGHPGWNFSPGQISVSSGKTVRVKNEGGEGHTFTEVSDFGGGFVPPLNGVGGPSGTMPLLEAGGCMAPPDVILPGNAVKVTGLSKGVHKFQCCIHPWMRSVVTVE